MKWTLISILLFAQCNTCSKLGEQQARIERLEQWIDNHESQTSPEVR